MQENSCKLFLFADLVWQLELDLKLTYLLRYRGDKPLTIFQENVSFRNQLLSLKDSKPNFM